MKLMHIYRSEPDETTRVLASAWDDESETTEFHLYREPVDYDRLVELIFECDRVLTWF